MGEARQSGYGMLLPVKDGDVRRGLAVMARKGLFRRVTATYGNVWQSRYDAVRLGKTWCDQVRFGSHG